MKMQPDSGMSATATPVTPARVRPSARKSGGVVRVPSPRAAVLPVMRIVSVTLGSGLTMAAFGIWAVPGSFLESDLLVIKSMLSLIFLYFGYVMLAAGRQEIRESVQLDLRNRVLSVQTIGSDELVRSTRRYTFDELGRLELRGRVLRAHDRSGALVATVPLRDDALIKEVRAAI